jgi:hypothetical protein
MFLFTNTWGNHTSWNMTLFANNTDIFKEQDKLRKLSFSRVENLWLFLNRLLNVVLNHFMGLSWTWSYGSWIYNYLCNQCLSPLMLWVRILIRARCTTLCDKVVSDLQQVGGFLQVLWFPPPIKLTATI